jgi:hypothetical protein
MIRDSLKVCMYVPAAFSCCWYLARNQHSLNTHRMQQQDEIYISGVFIALHDQSFV